MSASATLIAQLHQQLDLLRQQLTAHPAAYHQALAVKLSLSALAIAIQEDLDARQQHTPPEQSHND